MSTFIKSAFAKLKAALIYPAAVFVVTSYCLISFTRLWLQGYGIDYIFQILFVDLQRNVNKLIKRSAYFAPFFYIIILYLLFGSVAAIIDYSSKLFSI
jgi:hypothetical protein